METAREGFVGRHHRSGVFSSHTLLYVASSSYARVALVSSFAAVLHVSSSGTVAVVLLMTTTKNRKISFPRKRSTRLATATGARGGAETRERDGHRRREQRELHVGGFRPGTPSHVRRAARPAFGRVPVYPHGGFGRVPPDIPKPRHLTLLRTRHAGPGTDTPQPGALTRARCERARVRRAQHGAGDGRRPALSGRARVQDS